MSKDRQERQEPAGRISPTDAADEAVERLVGRRLVAAAESGDAVLIRETVPTLTPTAAARSRYRLVVHPGADGPKFNSFQHAVAEGEQLAGRRRTRLLLNELGVISVLSDYRSS